MKTMESFLENSMFFLGLAIFRGELLVSGSVFLGGSGLTLPRLVDWPFPKRQVVKGKNRGGIDIKPAHVSPGGLLGNFCCGRERKMEKIRKTTWCCFFKALFLLI